MNDRTNRVTCSNDVAARTTLPCLPSDPDWFAFASRLVLAHAAALKTREPGTVVVRLDDRRGTA